MKLMPCPINGTRPISEFVCGGEVCLMPNPQGDDDVTWANDVFNRNGISGIQQEWW